MLPRPGLPGRQAACHLQQLLERLHGRTIGKAIVITASCQSKIGRGDRCHNRLTGDAVIPEHDLRRLIQPSRWCLLR